MMQDSNENIPTEPKRPMRHPAWLKPEDVFLRIDESGFLEGRIGEMEFTEISARAAMPFAKPGRLIELRTRNREHIGFILKISELDPDSRTAVRKAVAAQHFVPLIERIQSIKGSHHCYTWKVSTDRGDTEFTTAGRRQNVEEVGNDEYIVTDSAGNRYRIPSTPNLDARSLAQLRKIL